MKRINNVLTFTIEEFREVCDKVLNENAWLEFDSGSWFWVTTEKINEDEINGLLEMEFGKEISGFRIENIYVDVTKRVVVVAYK